MPKQTNHVDKSPALPLPETATATCLTSVTGTVGLPTPVYFNKALVTLERHMRPYGGQHSFQEGSLSLSKSSSHNSEEAVCNIDEPI